MEGGVWGLVIIFAAFMIQFLAFGTTSTIGVYNIELLEYFPGNTIGVSLIASLNYGIFLGSGPIVSFLMTRFSYRKIALFGSALHVLGLLGMPLLPYIPTMCICLGVMTGFGSCCAYIPSHVLSGMYYDKNRSLATGVATSGSGLGGAVMPVVAGLLIEIYSWKGSLVVVAALCLHMFIFSALLRMPEPNAVSDQAGEDPNDNMTTPMLPDQKSLESQGNAPSQTTKPLKSLDLGEAGTDGESKPLISEVSKSVPASNLPLVLERDRGKFSDRDKPSEPEYMKMGKSSVTSKEHYILPTEMSSLKATSPVSDPQSELKGKGYADILVSKDPLKTRLFKPSSGLNGKSDAFSLEDLSGRSRSHTVMVTSDTDQGNRQAHLRGGSKSTDNNLSSNGWRLSHSLSSLHTVGTTRGSYYIVLDKADDVSATNQTHHTMLKDSDTHLEEKAEKSEGGEAGVQKKKKGPNSSRHIYIFTHYGFNIYFFSNIMWNAGCSIVTSFAPEFLRSQGLTSMEAAVLLGAFGFGCFVGGIFGGLLGNVSCINRQVLYTLANIIMGAVLIVFPSMGHRDLYLTALLVSGLAFGIILGLLIIVLTDLIGVESLSNGLGYLMLSNGIGTFLGPPLAGVLKETTGGFESGIILSGVLCVCGGLIMLLMPCRDLFSKLFLICCPCRRKEVKVEGNATALKGVEGASC